MRTRIAIVASALVGVTVPTVGRAQQSWNPVTLTVNHPSTDDLARTSNGKLRKTQNEFTNEQGVVKFFGDGVHGLYVEMRTGDLANGTKPTDKVQCAATPIAIAQN